MTTISAKTILETLIRACEAMSPEQAAYASITGKREALFRDLLLAELATSFPNLLLRAEWNISKEAVERWKSSPFAEDKSKGIVDLVAVSKSNPLTQIPAIAIEFKLWYWFDALNDAKYGLEWKLKHHSITASFLADVMKLRSVSNDLSCDNFVVTVVPTFLTDKIKPDLNVKVASYLKGLGFPYSSHKFVDSSDSGTDRDNSLKKISQHFNDQGCPSIVGGEIHGCYKGVNVITDFIVSKIPGE